MTIDTELAGAGMPLYNDVGYSPHHLLLLIHMLNNVSCVRFSVRLDFQRFAFLALTPILAKTLTLIVGRKVLSSGLP